MQNRHGALYKDISYQAEVVLLAMVISFPGFARVSSERTSIHQIPRQSYYLHSQDIAMVF